MAIPYAPSRMYEDRSSIGDLILRAGENKARGLREGGQIWGNAISNIGQLAAGTIRDIAEGRAAEKAARAKAEADRPRLESEQKMRDIAIRKGESELEQAEMERKRTEEFNGLLMGETEPTAKDLIRVLGPRDGAAAWSALQTTKPDVVKRFTDKQEVLKKGLLGVAAVPEAARAKVYEGLRQNYLAQGLITEQDAPAQYDPEWFAQALNFGEKPKEVKEPEGFSLSPGQVRFSPDGKVIASAPREPKPPKEPTYKEIEGRLYIVEGDKARPVNVPGGEVKPSTPGEASFVNQPGFKALPTPAKTQVAAAADLIRTAKAYRDKLLEVVDDTGIKLTGSDAAELNAMNAALLFKGAKGFGQGALQAPDKAVMEQMFPNPANIKAAPGTFMRGGKAGLKQSLDSAINQLETDLFRTYGMKLDDQAPLETGTRVSTPSKGKPVLINGVWERR